MRGSGYAHTSLGYPCGPSHRLIVGGDLAKGGILVAFSRGVIRDYTQISEHEIGQWNGLLTYAFNEIGLTIDFFFDIINWNELSYCENVMFKVVYNVF